MSKPEGTKKERKDKDGKDIEKPVVAKTAYDLQRLKLMKLMKNPEKPVLLPERPKSKNSPSVPEFVRNVMGSSAGAGSGEFHVYRHLRRKEYSRQKFIQEKGRKETLDEEYHQKLEQNKIQAEQTTAKKRAKRLKKKQKQKQLKKLKPAKDGAKEEKNQSDGSHSDSDSSEDESAEKSAKTETDEKSGEIETVGESEKTEEIHKENVSDAGSGKVETAEESGKTAEVHKENVSDAGSGKIETAEESGKTEKARKEGESDAGGNKDEPPAEIDEKMETSECTRDAEPTGNAEESRIPEEKVPDVVADKTDDSKDPEPSAQRESGEVAENDKETKS